MQIISTEMQIIGAFKEKICYFCSHIGNSPVALKQHLINEHCDLIFCCGICNNALPRSILISHMTKHANNDDNLTNYSKFKNNAHLKCDKCNRSFKSVSGIKYHINSKHTKLKTFSCSQCTFIFNSKRVLENHIRGIHNQDKRHYVCKYCNKSFKTDATLYIHKKLHSEHRPFKCTKCSYTCRLKHHLTEHIERTHQQCIELPYECLCCHKKFAAADNLRKHKKTHDQSTEFPCHICGTKMRQKRYLRQHMKNVHLQSSIERQK